MRKEKTNCTVLMVGPAAGVKGGIRTVVEQYLSWEHWEQVKLLYVPTYVDGFAVKKLLFFLAGLFRIIGILLTRRVDVVHLHVSERGSFWRKAMVLSLGKAAGAKVILHHHGAEFFDFYEKASPRVKKRIAGVIRRADENIVLSRYHCRMMEQRFPQGKFMVLYNAVSGTEARLYHPEARGIAFVGRLGQRKGTYDLIRAMEAMEPELPPDIRFFFCGDGEVEQVSGLLREKGLMHRVGHLGWCSKDELRALLARSMVYILPSYHEGLPMSLLEAMYAGLPCVATNVDGIPEAIHSGSNGILVEPGDPAQISAALLRLVRSPGERMALGEAARHTVQTTFLLAPQVEKLTALYKGWRKQ